MSKKKNQSYKFDTDAIRKMATLAAEYLIDQPAPSSRVITREYLYDLADFPHKPDVGTATQMEEWSLSELSFMSTVRDMVMEELGRWLLTVRGEGVRLLTPVESVRYGLNSAIKKVTAAVRRGSKIVNQASVSGEVDTQEQSRAQIRLGQIEGVSDMVKKLADQDRRFQTAKKSSKRRSLRDELGLDNK